MHAHTVTVASIPSVTSSALALEGLALLWDALGCGVTVVGPSIAGVDQLRSCYLSCREEERYRLNHINKVLS